MFCANTGIQDTIVTHDLRFTVYYKLFHVTDYFIVTSLLFSIFYAGSNLSNKLKRIQQFLIKIICFSFSLYQERTVLIFNPDIPGKLLKFTSFLIFPEFINLPLQLRQIITLPFLDSLK